MARPRIKLINERKRRGMTQEDVARAVGYKSQGAVSEVERGVKRPSHRVMGLWADLFGMTVDELFFDSEHHELPSSSQATNTA